MPVISQTSNLSGTISASLAGAKNIKITNLSMPLALTEYSLVLQANLKEIMIRNRTDATLQYAFILGDSSLKYITIPKGCRETIAGLDLTGNTLYLQANKAGTVSEIRELF